MTQNKTFEDLHLITPILQALKHQGYTVPTPIQEQAIPVLLDKKDIIGCAQTGTGKTAAFAIPILQLLSTGHQRDPHRKKIRALILTPTRELAIQIGESFHDYGRHLGLTHTVIFGGVNQNRQTLALRKGVDILIATPGRLLDLMGQRFVHLEEVEIFTLDEADRMLDMGFIRDVKKIIAQLPTHRQTLFFSATMPPAIVELSKNILRNPVRIEVTPPASTAETVIQHLYYVDRDNKKDLLLHVLEKHNIPSALVFARTKYGADKVARFLCQSGVPAEAIHGNKSQNARQKALQNFKEKRVRVLVATDIAARGIDIDELSHVINFEIPNEPETYVHRIGRTGRAGASGTALSFCDAQEYEFLKDIHRLIPKQIPVENNHPHPMQGIPRSMTQFGRRGGGGRSRYSSRRRGGRR
ncbi:DEAD/DEAH box helicase [Candidatus Gracilibacteria bacterium]|nr:DEAD/DEAH box helicase [Candidatus Gracilibacteria bacterium]